MGGLANLKDPRKGLEAAYHREQPVRDELVGD